MADISQEWLKNEGGGGCVYLYPLFWRPANSSEVLSPTCPTALLPSTGAVVLSPPCRSSTPRCGSRGWVQGPRAWALL